MSLAAPPRSPAPQNLAGRSDRTGLVLGILLVLVAMIGLPLAIAIARGDAGYTALLRSYPGSVTAMIATVARSLTDLASWLTAGSLVILLFLNTRSGSRRAIVDDQLEWRIARWSSLAWAIGAAVMIPIDAADDNGLPLDQAFDLKTLGYLMQITYLPVAWLVTFTLATIAVLVINFSSTWTGLLVPAWCTAMGLLAPVVVGQILVGPNHDFGSDAGIVQALAVGAAGGACLILALRVGLGQRLAPSLLRRFALFAGGAWVLAALSGIVLAFFKLNGPGAWINPTWYLVLAQGGVLLLLGILLVAARALARAGALAARALILLLGSAAVLTALFLGLSEAMRRVPPPQYFLPSDILDVYFGYELPTPPDFAVLATFWRPNLLFVALSVCAIAVYLAAVLRLRRRGDRWPMGRTVSWILGWLVVIVSTSSGFGLYSGANFGIHMIVHMSLNMLAPLLLVLGGVLTLLLRATTPHRRDEPAGPHEWITAVMHWPGLRVLFNPLVVFVLYIGSYYGLYLTPLFDALIRYHWGHQLMNMHFLIAGYLYYGLIIGVDRPPRPLPPIGKLGYVLAAMPFHAFFGIILMTASEPVAGNFYATLDLPWNRDLMVAQYLGGGVAWAGGEIPLLIVIVVLGIQWARQDQREGIRKDRHMDAGLDDDFEVYNEMLARLAQRGSGKAPTS